MTFVVPRPGRKVRHGARRGLFAGGERQTVRFEKQGAERETCTLIAVDDAVVDRGLRHRNRSGAARD